MADTKLKREDQIAQRQEDVFNPHHPNAAELRERENAALRDYADSGANQAEAFANDPANASEKTATAEQSAGAANAEQGNWVNKATKGGKDAKKTSPQSIWGALKGRKGAVGGVIGGFGVLGVLFSIFTAPLSFLVGIHDSIMYKNDSTSTAQERMFMKVFGNATKTTDPFCKSSSKNIKCKMGKISNKALRQLERKGVYAEPERTKRTGYPDQNPERYRFELSNGSSVSVNANEMASFLAQRENRGLAAKVFGRTGAFKVRYQAWAGKHITQKFYSKIKGLNRNGGIADGKNKGLSREERRAKVESALPSMEDNSSSALTDINDKVTKTAEKAKKGGAIYTTAVAGCLAVQMPRLIAAGVAAVQLAQVLPIFHNLAASPGSKAKANGVENNFTPEDGEMVGDTFTERVPDEKGALSSAMDSPYLLAATGANTGKPAVSKDYAPGYAALMHQSVQRGSAVEQATKKECDIVLSPEAMYAAFAANAATTVALSPTIVGGIIKFFVSWAASEIASNVVGHLAKAHAEKIFREIAQNDKIPQARGKALGDVIGIGAAAFFAGGGMAHNLPTLKKSQLTSYMNVMNENENFHREMDIASLSPFDTSSRHTFMGSIAYNVQMASLSSGSSGATLLTGSLSHLPRLLSSAVWPKAQAEGEEALRNYCGYDKDFQIESDVAINMSGLPCTGITEEQAAMTTERAIQLMVSEGWIDGDADINDDWTVQSLLDNDIIKEDTPLRDFIDNCTDATTGDYMLNAAGCSIDCTSNCSGSGNWNKSTPHNIEEVEDDDNSKDPDRTVEDVKNPQSLAAMPVFLNHFYLHSALNGEDEQLPEATATTTTSGTGPTGDISEPDFKKNPAVQVDEGDGERACPGDITVGARSLASSIESQWKPPVTSIGGYACRANTASPGSYSIHAYGRALDIMVDGTSSVGLKAGDEIRNWLINNSTELGVQRVIWNRHIWSAYKDGWNAYTGPNPHVDHVHAEINIKASKNPNLGK